MKYLKWINNIDVENAINTLIDNCNTSIKDKETDIYKNVIDPFSAVFQMAGFKISYDDWVESEKIRQSQKSLQNHIGEFHQKILGSCKGWNNLGTGGIIDLVNSNKRIIAEIKNKHNTISGGNLSNLYDELHSLVMPKNSQYKGFTAYLVNIIPKKPNRVDTFFTPARKQTGSRAPSNNLIRIIDGASFYTLVTGDSNALSDLFHLIPKIISKRSKITARDKKKLSLLFTRAYGS